MKKLMNKILFLTVVVVAMLSTFCALVDLGAHSFVAAADLNSEECVYYNHASAAETEDGTEEAPYKTIQGALNAATGTKHTVVLLSAIDEGEVSEGKLSIARTSSSVISAGITIVKGYSDVKPMFYTTNKVTVEIGRSGSNQKYIFDGENKNYSVVNNGVEAAAFTLPIAGSSFTTKSPTVFKNFNLTNTGNKGVVYVNAGSDGSVVLNNTIFQNNTATTGAINAEATFCSSGLSVNASGSITISLTNCQFLSNTGTRSANICGAATTTLSLQNCKFEGNTSINSSSSMHVFGCGTVTLESCAFNSNTASGTGAGDLSMGCGLMFVNVNALTIKGCGFENNSGVNGADIYSYSGQSETNEMTIAVEDYSSTHTTFTNSTSSDSGSANFYVVRNINSVPREATVSTFSITNAVFASSRTRAATNALIVMDPKELTLDGVSFSGFGATAFSAKSNKDSPSTGYYNYTSINVLNSHFYNCQKGIDFNKVGNWTVTNSTFEGFSGYGMIGLDATSLSEPQMTINASTFKNCSSNSGALHVKNGKLTIKGSTFDRNTNPVVPGENVVTGGAAINVEELDKLLIDTYTTTTPTTSTNCTFSGNTATASNGGAIYVKDVTDFEIKNATFTNNLAGQKGGAVYFNKAAVETEVKIDNSSFNRNYAQLEGGAFYVNVTTFELTNSSFASNRSDSSAGAIYLASSSTNVTINSVAFSDNVAKDTAGALYIDKIPNLVLTGTRNATTGKVSSTFSGNTAMGKASAIALIDTVGASINHIGLTNNILSGTELSDKSGGALYIENSSVSIEESEFNQNRALAYGGALAIWINEDGHEISISGSNFLSNTILNSINDENATSINGNGGAIAVIDNSNDGVKISFNDCKMTANNADNFGGAFYYKGSAANSELLLRGCDIGGFIGVGVDAVGGNDASVQAGAIYVEDAGRLTMLNTTISNHVIEGTDSKYVVYVVNTAGATYQTAFEYVGGSLTSNTVKEKTNLNELFYVEGNVVSHIDDVLFDGNACAIQLIGFSQDAKLFTIENSRFFDNHLENNQNNELRNIGLVNIFDPNNILRGCYFGSNTTGSTNNCAGVYLSGNNYSYTILDCVFEENSSQYGAAVYVAGSQNDLNNITLTLENCNFVGNKACSGGAVMSFDQLNIKNCQFLSNEAIIGNLNTNVGYNVGGAVFGQKIEVISSIFSNNRAKAGGAIYIGALSGEQITGHLYLDRDVVSEDDYSTFISNSATNGDGGAIYIDKNCAVMMHGGKFIQNVVPASNKGTAVSNLGEFIIYDGIFEQNGDDSISGGAISNAGQLSIYNLTASNNRAKSGAVLYLGGASQTTTIYDANFACNYASEYGGAITVSAGTLSLLGAKFTGNKAQNSGGSLHATGNAVVNVFGGSFSEDVAKNGASITMASSAKSHISGITIKKDGKENETDDEAVTEKGALYIASGDVYLSDILIDNCYSTGYGAGIYYQSGMLYLSRSIVISGNKKVEYDADADAYVETSSNIYVATVAISIVNPLLNTSQIKVMTAVDGNSFEVAKGAEGYILKTSDYARFASDDEQVNAIYYRITVNSGAVSAATIYANKVGTNATYVASDFYGDKSTLNGAIEVKLINSQEGDTITYYVGTEQYTTSPELSATTTVYFDGTLGGNSLARDNRVVFIANSNGVYIETMPTILQAIVNSKLSDVEFQGGVAKSSGLEIAGTFDWVNPNAILSTIGYHYVEMRFTPTSNIYSPIVFTIPVYALGYNNLYFYKQQIYASKVYNPSVEGNYEYSNNIISVSTTADINSALRFLNDGGSLYFDTQWVKPGNISIDNRTVYLRFSDTGSAMFNVTTGTLSFGSANTTGKIIIDGMNLSTTNPLIEVTGSGAVIFEGNIIIQNYRGNPQTQVVAAISIHDTTTNVVMKWTGLRIENAVTTQNLNYGRGGAVYIKAKSDGTPAATVIMEEVVITNCSASFGGGVFIDSGNVYIYSLEISNCSAASDGGGLYIGEHANVIIFDINVHDNTAINGAGAYFVYLPDIYQGHFDNNRAEMLGGGIYTERGSKTGETCGRNVYDYVYVTNNTAVNGAGIYAAAESNFNYFYISNNTAQYYGGGVFFATGISKISESVIASNVVRTSNSPVQIQTQDENVAAASENRFAKLIVDAMTRNMIGGGGIFAFQVDIRDCVIVENGIIYNGGQNDQSPTIYGGGVFLYYPSGSDAILTRTISGTSIDRNFISGTKGSGFGAGVAVRADADNNAYDLELSNANLNDNYFEIATGSYAQLYSYSDDYAARAASVKLNSVSSNSNAGHTGIAGIGSPSATFVLSGICTINSPISTAHATTRVANIFFDGLNEESVVEIVIWNETSNQQYTSSTGASYLIAQASSAAEAAAIAGCIKLVNTITSNGTLCVVTSVGNQLQLYADGSGKDASTTISSGTGILTYSNNVIDGGTIIITGTQTIETNVTLSFPGVTIVRGNNFSSSMFSITGGKTLVLENVIIDASLAGQNNMPVFDIENGTVIIKENVVIKNANPAHSGGVFKVGQNGKLIIYDGEFYNNITAINSTHSPMGAVIYTEGQVDIYGGTFADNYANNGGNVIYVAKGKTTIHDGLFIENNYKNVNKKTSVGGVIYVSAGASLEIKDGTFVRNESFAGAVVYNKGETVISGGRFDQNIAFALFENNNGSNMVVANTGLGGVAYNYCGNLTITGGYFYNNIAHKGGAIAGYGTRDNNSIVDIRGGHFVANSASFGGAFYATSYSKLTIYDGQIAQNTAVSGNPLYYLTLGQGAALSGLGQGGGIFAEQNANLHIVNGEFRGNSAVEGGAIFSQIVSGITAKATDEYLVQNQLSQETTKFIIDDALFEGNSATNGGGSIFVFGGTNSPSTLIINGGIFATSESADGYGGALYLKNFAYASICGPASFERNSGSYGAIYISSFSQLRIDDGSFENNQSLYASAIYIYGNDNNEEFGLCIVNGGRITANKISTQDGGAIYCAAGVSKLYVGDKAYIAGNASSSLVQNIYLNNDSKVTIYKALNYGANVGIYVPSNDAIISLQVAQGRTVGENETDKVAHAITTKDFQYIHSDNPEYTSELIQNGVWFKKASKLFYTASDYIGVYDGAEHGIDVQILGSDKDSYNIFYFYVHVNITGGMVGPAGDAVSTEENPGNVFGGGKGLANTFWCEKGMVYSTNVSISNGTVKGSVYGGGELGRVETDTKVTIGPETGAHNTEIKGNVFGAGKGVETHGYSALVRGNTEVIVQNGSKVNQNVYGGGEIASVGKYSVDSNGMPYSLANNGSGICHVTIPGATQITGDIFGGGKGFVPSDTFLDYETYTGDDLPKRMTIDGNGNSIWQNYNNRTDYLIYLQTLALATETEVIINPGTSATPIQSTKGNVYGGSENGIVQHSTSVTISGDCKIGDEGIATSGNIYGGGKGHEKMEGAGLVGDDATVNINSGTMIGSVYGGGVLGATKGNVTVNINGGTVNHDVYGGGALAHTNTSNWHLYSVVTGLTPGSSSVSGYYERSFGGAYSLTTDVNAVENKTYYTKNESATWIDSEQKSALNKTRVNLRGGTIVGDAYGGALGDATHSPKVYGDIQVNLNKETCTDGITVTTKASTDAGCVVNKIFGCNNAYGSPQGDVTVHVYATQNAAATHIANQEADTDEATMPKKKERYDVQAVYGGGNKAAYDPVTPNTSTTTTPNGSRTMVIIEGCELTSIDHVYGGGNAAPVPATDVTIKGTYQINAVYGGGNGSGEGNPGADVGKINDSNYGTGKAITKLLGGPANVDASCSARPPAFACVISSPEVAPRPGVFSSSPVKR